MSTSKTSGLRDRKRTETAARIHAAAVSLVLSGGLDAATIEAISERADVSPRTFFNYYEGKDAAILGIQPDVSDDAAFEDVLAVAETGSVDPLTLVIRLVLATMGTSSHVHTPARHADRMTVIQRHPELITGQFAQLAARRTRTVEYAARILAAHPAWAADPASAPSTPLVIALCGAAVKTAIEDWAATTPDQPLDENHLEERALALVHHTIRSLQ
ncbi:TetR/AcrR family transcriptional regulator [Branchiibius sp. NY16-3462-2]|uniref:TetR/AcrR family transcriptional regulator n=1 Tax=Branchiibius sp. NY16-3462-2 TaxID=1807500 RepID=UPI000794381E|nr:helix-turn-helix domain-containing protein [Branchiibius sp. NY16-3462-2]KYH45140.1 hypothetical protein AZH51_14760 [Branchiibius sp. NY16-3462-2]